MDFALRGPLQLGLASFALTILVVKAIRVVQTYVHQRVRLPLPPGPRGYPVISDVFSLEVLGQRIIVLNSLEAVQDLFEKRSANYSDRTRMPMLLELMKFDFNFAMLPYGQWWRRHQRAFNQHFHAGVVQKYQPIQAKTTRAFLDKLLRSPKQFPSLIRETLASSIMNVVYGIEIKGIDDPYVTTVEESLDGLNTAGIPGTFLVDLIPILKYVPRWFPGAEFKRKAAHWARTNHEVVERPFEHVRKGIQAGTAGSSVTASLISALPEESKQRAEGSRVAKGVTAITYIAGADTTYSSIQTFFLEMALHPEVQAKAQAELNAVVGPNRLPQFSDRPALPYINAIIKETLRWQPVLPLSVPHMATDLDVYRGYLIPKGAIVIGNAWAILHDPSVFENPEEFNPERFLKDGQLDHSVRQPEASAFGFGRRICPGRYFADNTIFLLIASILHVFDIAPSLSKTGEPVALSPKMTSGLMTYPEPFEIDIKPRSAAAESLVKNEILGDN